MNKSRILSYDLFRGVLIVGMIVFHILVNLTELQFDHRFFYWVPLGFIMFLGVVLAKFLKGRSRKKLNLAFKLFAVFVILNIPNFIGKDLDLMMFINGNQEILSFEILLPMTFLILISVLLDKLKKPAILLGTSFLLLIGFNYFDVYLYNWLFLLYGVVGYALVDLWDLDACLAKMNKCGVGILALLLGLSLWWEFSFGVIDIIALMQVVMMYFLSGILLSKNKLLISFGKNSLVIYVAHIVLIKLITLAL